MRERRVRRGEDNFVQRRRFRRRAVLRWGASRRDNVARCALGIRGLFRGVFDCEIIIETLDAFLVEFAPEFVVEDVALCEGRQAACQDVLGN